MVKISFLMHALLTKKIDIFYQIYMYHSSALAYATNCITSLSMYL